ncbi:MAG: hypothetical protein E7234_11590 [Lachnospiraceae bacterium]|nr:hypothetical protein [Lachnospiraceae bacterium]
MIRLKISEDINKKDLRKELEAFLQALLKFTPLSINLKFVSEGFISKYFSLMEETAKSELLNMSMKEDLALSQKALEIQESFSNLLSAFPVLIKSDVLNIEESLDYSSLLERASSVSSAAGQSFSKAASESQLSKPQQEALYMNSKEDIREISQRLALLNSQSLLGRGIK